MLHEGIKLENHYDGKVINNRFGEFFHISSIEKVKLKKPDLEIIKQNLVCDISVIDGIGEKSKKKLNKQGFISVYDLLSHPKFGNDAAKYICEVENNDVLKIYDRLSKRFTSTNQLFISNSALFDFSEILFIDIETLGLGESPIFLIGIAGFKENNLIIDQFFIRKLKEEKSALVCFNESLKEKKAIFSFNGKSFDIPRIQKRMGSRDIDINLNIPHFDLKYLSQKAYAKRIDDFKLTTIERIIFKEIRKNDVPSSSIPGLYKDFLDSNNFEKIVTIIDHNKKDLITSSKIYLKLINNKLKK